MPQLDNKEIIECILKSTINVISRRTSDTYANVVVDNSLKGLTKKYNFFRFVKIIKTEYQEIFDIVDVKPEINNVDIKLISKAVNDLMQNIINSLGKNVWFC